jgi:hypothetical protein
MAGYQFFHIETYARIPSKNHKKQSARGVAKEAERDSESCPHIINPQNYKLMFGSTPSEVVAVAEERADLATDKLGRKLRKDAQIMLAGVASYPVPISELNPNDEALNYWLKLNYKFLRKKYGNRLKSIVAHTDEPFFHIHFYIIPDFDDPQTKKLSIAQVHDGIRARNFVGGKKAKEKMSAYKEAMRGLQDEYFESVGKLCGLTREGANKRRLTRCAWKVEQAAAERLANSLKVVKDIENKAKTLDLEQRELLCERKGLLERETKLVTLKSEADKTLGTVKNEKNSLINLRAEKDNVVKYLKNKVQKFREQVSKLLKTISQLKNENKTLIQEVNSLGISERNLIRINEKLTYQNELRAKALKQDRADMFDIVKLASIGKIEEIKEKYDKNNNNKEYVL